MLTAAFATLLKSLAGAKLAALGGFIARELCHVLLGLKPRLKALVKKIDDKLGLDL